MKTLIFTALIIMAPFSFAGGGHFHPKKVAKCPSQCNEEQIREAVPAGIEHLEKWGRLDSGWSKATIERIEKKVFTNGSKSLSAWVVSLFSADKKDSKKTRRYVYFTEDGLVFRSNTSGALK